MFAIFGALCLLMLQATLAPAQLITLRDGKLGVNFAGYHADAGLGGLLTGDAAHGGLSASAGTPWGARSAAGLRGGLNGSPAGVAYAAAQANDDVGASAVLGGRVGEHGYIGSEAHVPGKVEHSSVHLQPQHESASSAPLDNEPLLPTARPSYVQKVKPPHKKYSLIAQNRQRLRVKRPRQRQRTVYITQQQQQQYSDHEQEEQGKTLLQASHSDEPAKATPKSDAKVVHQHKYSQVAAQRPQVVTSHVIAPQAQNSIVGNALDVSLPTFVSLVPLLIVR
ncbi:GH20659 [Drosophila grimshawi]|uniref:GH20659 n=1 Tax=Drosophila grimshawi TaxID=7222 RepID=B4J7D9_DROGR|nr:GH20659 [Drosophila grimshawi]